MGVSTYTQIWAPCIPRPVVSRVALLLLTKITFRLHMTLQYTTYGSVLSELYVLCCFFPGDLLFYGTHITRHSTHAYTVTQCEHHTGPV